MNDLKIFEFENQNIRIRIDDVGNPWWVARDVCTLLGLGNITEAMRALDEDERGSAFLNTPGGKQEMLTVNEPGLYSLVLRSRKPEAKKFKRWIIHEVLPAIRKHSAYLTPQKIEEVLCNPDMIIRLATDLKKEREQRLRLALKVKKDAPKVIFAESVSVSHTSILVGDLAKLLRQNGIQMGQNRLFDWLRYKGYLIKSGSSRNMPTQRSMELGLFEIKERTINNPDGSVRITRTPKVTGKGQIYFANLFLTEVLA